MVGLVGTGNRSMMVDNEESKLLNPRMASRSDHSKSD